MMEKSDLWSKCVDPNLTLIGKANKDAVKAKLRKKSEKWNGECEAQRRVERGGIKGMVAWILGHIKKIAALCPQEMKTESSILAAMTIAVRLHPDFVKQLHARLAEGPGVFRTKVEDSDVRNHIL